MCIEKLVPQLNKDYNPFLYVRCEKYHIVFDFVSFKVTNSLVGHGFIHSKINERTLQLWSSTKRQLG